MYVSLQQKIKTKKCNKQKWITNGIKASSKVKILLFININYRRRQESQTKYFNYKSILKKYSK